MWAILLSYGTADELQLFCRFYGSGLRLPLLAASDEWAEFELNKSSTAPRLVIQAVNECVLPLAVAHVSYDQLEWNTIH